MIQIIGSWLFMLFCGVGLLYVAGAFIFMSGNPADWGIGPRAALAIVAAAYTVFISWAALKQSINAE